MSAATTYLKLSRKLQEEALRISLLSIIHNHSSCQVVLWSTSYCWWVFWLSLFYQTRRDFLKDLGSKCCLRSFLLLHRLLLKAQTLLLLHILRLWNPRKGSLHLMGMSSFCTRSCKVNFSPQLYRRRISCCNEMGGCRFLWIICLDRVTFVYVLINWSVILVESNSTWLSGKISVKKKLLSGYSSVDDLIVANLGWQVQKVRIAVKFITFFCHSHCNFSMYYLL